MVRTGPFFLPVASPGLASAHISECGAVPRHERPRQYHGRTPLPYAGWGAIGRVLLGLAQREEILHRAAVEHIIDFLEINHLRKAPAGTLPYGLQKRVELGRALAAEPKLLLLDEPMAGMNLEEKEDMARFILDVNDEWGTAMVLIEHDMGVVMDISHRVVVLDHGEKIAEGAPDDVRTDPVVVRAYLGEDGEGKQGA